MQTGYQRPAFCQKADMYYNCGQTLRPVWLYNNRFDHLEWTIMYIDGWQWRVTFVNFIVDPSVEKPTIRFISESPYEQVFNLSLISVFIFKSNVNSKHSITL